LQLREEGNAEVVFAWLQIAVQHQYQAAVPTLERFLTTMGRRKFVLPLFTSLWAEGDWGRAFISNRGMAETASGWRGRLHLLDWWHSRLSRVQLDSRDALTVIRYWESPDTTFYLDPPYVADTRVKGKQYVYRHEADDDHHRQLVELLLTIQGRAVLSGYDHPAYQPLTDAGWSVHRIKTACHAAGRIRGSKLRGAGNATKHAGRVEVVWVKGGSAKREDNGLFHG
jgi:hypothetical protein